MCAQNQPLPGGLRCNPGGSFAVIHPRHPRPVPHRPPSSALDVAEPRGIRRPHRTLLPLCPYPRRRHGAAQEHGVPPSSANWPRRASSRVSGALAAAMSTSSLAAFCQLRGGCPTSARRVSHRREEKNRQVRKPKALALDLPSERRASASCRTNAPSGRRGCAAGGSPASGCRSGVRSRPSRAASRRHP